MMATDPLTEPAYAVRVIRAEFTEMPGMQLTLPQAARLWRMRHEDCERVLDTLVRDGFLVRDDRRGYARRRDAR